MGYIFLAIAAGFIVGTLVGVTGVGGGALMTPFLILVMKVNPVLAIGTDLVFASITKWLGGIQHWHRNNVNLRMVGWMALGSMPASLLMSVFVISRVNHDAIVQQLVTKVMGTLLVIISLYSLARVFNWIKAREDKTYHWPPPWALVLLGVIGGALVGLTSVGSGSIIMACLLIFYSFPAAQMVGLDVMHGALLTMVPAIVYATTGHVDWNLGLFLLIGSLPGTWLGTRLVSVAPQRVMRGTLSVFLILMGVRLFL